MTPECRDIILSHYQFGGCTMLKALHLGFKLKLVSCYTVTQLTTLQHLAYTTPPSLLIHITPSLLLIRSVQLHTPHHDHSLHTPHHLHTLHTTTPPLLTVKCVTHHTTFTPHTNHRGLWATFTPFTRHTTFNPCKECKYTTLPSPLPHTFPRDPDRW